MKKLFSLVVVATLCLTTVCGQSKLSNWATLLLQQKKQMTLEQLIDNPMAKISMDASGKEFVDCYVHFNGSIDESVFAEYGAKLLTCFDKVNIVTAAVPLLSLEDLSNDSRVAYVEVARPVKLHLDKARQSSMVDAAQIGQNPLPNEFKGNGVVVGVIDGELQYGHPAFWDATHSRFRIKKVWNQNENGNAPEGFSYGWEYADSAAIINAKYDIKSSKAESGHATHVMGIAAGADHSLNYYGVAQEADLIFVSAASSEDFYSSGVKYIFDQADKMKKPCVVNLSMGLPTGPRDGSSTACKIVNSLVGPGRILCVSAGNSGYDNVHVGMSFTATDTIIKTAYSAVEISGSNYDYCLTDIWAEDTGATYQVRMVLYDKDSLKTVWSSRWCNAIPTGTKTTVDIVEQQSIRANNDFRISGSMVGSKNTNNNRGNVSVSVAIFSVPTRHLLGFEVKKTTEGKVHLFSTEDYGTFTNGGGKKFGFVDGDSEISITEPADAEGVITVGAYVSASKGGYGGTVGTKASFSSMGPTLDGRIKPEISAPGQTLMSAYPDFDAIKSGRKESVTVDGKTYWYGLMQGTSMSSPYAAGVIALWLQADSTLDRDGIIDVFQHSCILDNFTGSEVPNNQWGWGKINAYYGLLYILGYTAGVEDVTKPTVLGVYEDGNSDIFRIGFAKNMNDLSLRVYDMSGKVVYTAAESDVMAGDEVSVDLSNMTPGVYVINVGGENYKVVR